MFKSKHSGWTWELKRTPFGGGGGGDFFSAVTDPISSVLGTDGGGGGILGGLAQIDNAVNHGIPGGWATVGGSALLAAGIYDPTLIGLADSGNLTEAAITDAGLDPATVAADVSSTESGSGFGLNAGAPTTGAASPSGIAATQSAAGLGGSGTGIIEGLAPTSVGMGGTTGAGSLSGIAGTQAAAGLGGTNLGMGLTADQLAKYEAANPSLNTSNVSRLSDLLKSGAGSGLSNSLGKFAQGSNVGSVATTPWVHGNQNPFVQTQNLPIQNTPKLDVASLANLLKQG